MSGRALPATSPSRQLTLSALALLVAFAPDRVFSLVTTTPWELTILRMLALIGIAVIAVLPWAQTSSLEIRRRMRRWSLPGTLATGVYLVSGEALYLMIGFCLLTGAALDMWLTRAHLASDAMRDRLSDR